MGFTFIHCLIELVCYLSIFLLQVACHFSKLLLDNIFWEKKRMADKDPDLCSYKFPSISQVNHKKEKNTNFITLLSLPI